MKEDPENTSLRDGLTGDKVLEGHEYDGIKELDNKLPKWWVGLFYITIIFALVYVLRFHILKTSPLQEEEYRIEMAAAEQHAASVAEQAPGETTTTAGPMTDATNLDAGKAVYDKNCAVCHLAEGQGLVGPNLTDAYWIHGGSYEDIINIINVGVIEKGMIAWKDMLTPTEVQQVASFIMNMQGTNPPNPKAPEGDLYTPGT